MTFRKNRLLLLGAIAILSKWVVEERRKNIEGVPESQKKFRKMEDTNTGTTVNEGKDFNNVDFKGKDVTVQTFTSDSFKDDSTLNKGASTYSTTYSNVDENNVTSATDVFNNTVEILSIEKAKEENGIKANDGSEFYKIKTRFTNESKEEVKVSYVDFNLESEMGSERKVINNTYFEEKVVNPQEAIEGILVYEVPLDRKSLDLSFSVGGSLSRTKIKIK